MIPLTPDINGIANASNSQFFSETIYNSENPHNYRQLNISSLNKTVEN